MSTELKVVMFTDQVKFTRNTARRTHAEINEIAREQDDLTVKVLRLTRGTLLKDTGDGCLAQFSAVIDAVQAGVLLQRRVAERNATRSVEQMRFELHIGIDVGELIVLEDGDLRGDATNRGARICSECPPGEVYLSDTAARMLKDSEVELEPVGALLLKGIEGETMVSRVSALHVLPQDPPNPFVWRKGITSAEDFFDREAEQRTLRAYLHGRQNCQVVGPRRIGKTSLLRQIERAGSAWERGAAVAYLDLQSPRCFTLGGWLTSAARQFRWPVTPTTLAEFADLVDDNVSHGLRPVLCLDEFEELTARRSEFARDFFLTLRSCAQSGLSIVTASRRSLSELTERGDPSSPFYNTFPIVRIGPFNPEDAQDFVNLHRHGVPAFTPEERAKLLDFAKGHPLALQVACFHVLEAKQDGETQTAALQKAADNMKAHLPDGW
jgi:class 3 adenylate cyclase